jgi:hypothetical protein
MEGRGDELLEVVMASPARVAAHDKEGWLALFSTDAAVEDPVGTAPHRKGAGRRGPSEDDELGRFWDVFIAPNEIRFEVLEDIASPPWVVRDVVIHTRSSFGSALHVPAHLLYELTDERGEIKIRHLAAHWEVAGVSKQALSGGLSGLATITAQSWRMLRIQRLQGMSGYLRGVLGGIGRRGHAGVQRFAGAVDSMDERGLTELFVDDGERIAFPAGRTIAPDRFLRELGPGAAMAVRDARAAGWVASFRFEIRGPGAPGRGIGFLDFERASSRIARARLFPA